MNPADLLELLASTTWRAIDRAARNRIQYGEDAITSVNLNALASAAPPNVVVEDTRVNEATKGCDFEFGSGVITLVGHVTQFRQRRSMCQFPPMRS